MDVSSLGGWVGSNVDQISMLQIMVKYRICRQNKEVCIFHGLKQIQEQTDHVNGLLLGPFWADVESGGPART